MNRVYLLKAAATAWMILAVPHASYAQSTPDSAAQDPTAAATTLRPQDGAAGADHATPRHAARGYLEQAKSQLDAVSDANLDHDAKKLVEGLRQDFNALTTAYHADVKGDRSEARATIDGNVAGDVDWHARFSDIERRLALILGGGSSFSPSYASSGTLASSVAGATPSPGTQSKAASSQASATLVAPVTSPSTTVVTPAAPSAPSASAAAAAAAATTPPGTPPATVVTASGTGVTPASNPGAGTGSGSAASVAGSGGTVAAPTGAGVAAAAGVLVSTIGLKGLDPAARLQLEQFRTTVELFFDATTRLGS